MTSQNSEDKSQPLIEASPTSDTLIFQPPHLRNQIDLSQSEGSSEVSHASSYVSVEDENNDYKNKKGRGFELPGSLNLCYGDSKKKSNFVVVDSSKSRITFKRCINKIPRWAKTLVGIIVASLFFYISSVALAGTPFLQTITNVKDNIIVKFDTKYNVAFIGNSYLYVNDIPRLMESISEGNIQQNSCIHPSGSLSKVVRTGNGMYGRWDSSNAIQRTNLNNFYDYIDQYYVFYDQGACSVYQLLEGQDNDLVTQNYNGAYYDDGSNPCFQDEYYLTLMAESISNDNMSWDFIVLNDQTKRMAFEDSREDSIEALKYAYAPLIRDTGAVPILVDTHAYWSESGNMTGIQDVAYFTAEIYEGLREYMFALKYNLPDELAPKVAPVGLAYLTIYEEDNDMWKNLFLSDSVHASPAGSYLFACVLYCTIYGHLPPTADALGGVSALFEKARGVQDSYGYPSSSEAYYLRSIAKRVTLDKYVPSILSEYGDTAFILDDLEIDENEYQSYWNGFESSASDKNQVEDQWSETENVYEEGEN